MNEIARLVFPTEGFINNAELFVNKEENECVFNGKLTGVNVYNFDTWMNMFAPKKHYFYCDLGAIYLNLKIKGKYKILVIGSNRNAAFDRLDEILVDETCENDACIKIPNAEKYEGIYFSLIEDKNAPVEFYGGSWATDKEPQRKNKLAIVTCTFKRENYINKNIKLFEDFISANPDLKDYIKLIVVDNGKTLDTSRSNDMVKIIPNMNAGGAGGFTRGLMDVLENYSDFSRVLFMDDDVEIFPESFYRTLTLSNYLKEEYKDSFINGAMMNLYEKENFSGSCSVNRGFWAGGYINNVDISEYDNIMRTNDIPIEIFNDKTIRTDSAWWYCCFATDIARRDGLPLPLFFRGDDTEWGWRRNGYHHITMNGICVWHSPFEWRVSKVAEYYYMYRNVFMLNTIYDPNFKKAFKKHLKRAFRYIIQTYDYNSGEIFLRAMKDILKGGSVFKENPEEQFKEVNKIPKKVEYYKATEKELEIAKNSIAKAKKWRSLVFLITGEGKYSPDFLLKRKNIALEWFPPTRAFRLVKELKVYNLLTGMYTIRKFDRKRISSLKKEFYNLLNQIDKNYDKLHEDYIQSHKEFTTMEFWKKYLGLVET